MLATATLLRLSAAPASEILDAGEPAFLTMRCAFFRAARNVILQPGKP
jgi:hypothetical protein